VAEPPKESFAAGLVGVVLDGRYRLDAVLGEGGMGAVYRAHHLAMDRRVAVKLLKPHLTGDEIALERFAREARATMKIDSPHAVKVFDFGITPLKDYYMVLEYIDGRTVQRELEVDGTFAPRRAVHVVKQVLAALGTAHATGLVHRDVKPDNIILMRSGDDPDFAKVLDFGVAKLMDGAAQSTKSALALTQAGMVFGTPEFMSPEQACGQPLDGRSDLYSLAATLFAMLTGCGMYPAKSVIAWLTSHARTPPPHLHEADPDLAAYPELDRVLQRCLAKHRDQRPKDAAEMIAMLDEIAPTLERAPGESLAGATSPERPMLALVHSPSSYIVAIASDATIVPLSASVAPVEPTTTGVVAPAASRRRFAMLALGVGVVAGIIVATIVVASSRKHGPRATEPAAAGSAVAKPAEPRGSTIDAPSLDAAVAVAAAPEDAAAAPPPDAATIVSHPPRPPTPPTPPTAVRSELAGYLAEAETAARQHKVLTQFTKAEAVLRIDPRNVRARYLAGDALLQDNDLDRGCKYLRMIKRNPDAANRARTAGCPSD
jgi:serine/threonine protein kinase